MNHRKLFSLVLVALAISFAMLPARAADQWGQTPVGHWETDSAGLPVFVYTMDEFNDDRAYYPTSQGMSNDHWFLLGNGRMVALAYNHGEVVIYSGERGATWLNERDPKHNRFAGGYGFLKDGDTIISMRYPDRPEGCDYERRFGVGYFEKTLICTDLKITQRTYPPIDSREELVSEIEVENRTDRPRELTWYEYWDVNPHYFGTMIEIAGEGGESTGEGEGLSSASTVLEKVTKLIPGKFTLSKIVASGLHSWRSSFTNNFLLSTNVAGWCDMFDDTPPPRAPCSEDAYPYPLIIPTVFIQVTGQIQPFGSASEIPRYFPQLWLSILEGGTIKRFETRRNVVFDKRGKFTGKLENGLIKDQKLKNNNACLVADQNINLAPRGTKKIIFMISYENVEWALSSMSVSGMVSCTEKGCDNQKIFQGNMRKWKKVLPQINIGENWLNEEMLWHAYYLRAMATYDDYFENRIISQGCAYQYMMGMNIAARDPLQHMLPAVYLEPELARDVLRYTLRMMDGKGFIPYGIKGVGMRTAGGNPFPSDTILYLMLSVTEYVTATRDFAFLGASLPYYPKEDGATGTVMEHLQKGWRHFRDDVGVGANGLVKLKNSDWNDSFIAEEKSLDPSLDLRAVESDAESVLNTAMAIYILPRFSALVRSRGDAAWADEIDAKTADFNQALMKQWNGRWFNRAVFANGKVVGSDRIYLSLQPWAILGNALSPADETALDETIHTELSSRSPIGAVMRWPPFESDRLESDGMGTNGGVWYSLRFPLIMAYARQRPDYAWDEFIKMTNHAHAEAYPDVWIGQWSGPDAYNAPNSKAPGWTTDVFPFSGGMMDFPIMCAHAHAAPWFSLIKLMGIHPDPDGYTIAPRVPEQSFFLKTALIELERGPDSIRGALNPTAPSSLVWRVEVPAPPTTVMVSGEKTDWNMKDDLVVFHSPAVAQGRVEWTIKW